MNIMAQLAFNGNCRAAFTHYEKVLHGRIEVMNSLADTPGVPLPPSSKPSAPESIRFAKLVVDDAVLLGNDVPPDEFKPMSGFNVALHAQSVAEATRIFDALAEGGKVVAPLTRMPWAPRFGQLIDRFGAPWLVLATAE